MTWEEYTAYKKENTNKVNLRGGCYICFSCRKPIGNNENRWTLQKIIFVDAEKKIPERRHLHFHDTCMTEVAGDTYDIEEEITPDWSDILDDPFEPF